MTKKEAIDFMMRDPNLIKRPIVIDGSTILFGYRPDDYEKVGGA